MAQEFDKEYIDELAHKYKEGTLSKEEEDYFTKWYNSFEDERLELLTTQATDADAIRDRMHQALMLRVQKSSQRNNRNTHILWKRMLTAASIALVIGSLLYLYLGQKLSKDAAIQGNLAINVAPGSSKASLMLSDGSILNLTDMVNGTVATQQASTILKTSGNEIIYQQTAITGAQNLTNTIVTPMGGEYRLTLSDGTKVWLNAGTKLKYPVSFNSLENRKVELEGEAYFEVAKDKAHPFIVKTADQETKVLGTHFNINSYSNEGKTVVTLAEGSVNVKALSGNGRTIIPGQYASVSNGEVTTGKADLETALGWKNGQLEFKDADIKEIMRQVSRWYDIDVIFKGNVEDRRFIGTVSRSSNLSAVLRILEFSGVRFELSGGNRKTLTVIP